MKYRGICTHCVSPIMNIYPKGKYDYYADDKNIYVEVNTIEEAALIEQLNTYQKGSIRVYTELVKLTSNNH